MRKVPWHGLISQVGHRISGVAKCQIELPVEYAPRVPFPKKNITLWLPKQAEIYFNFR